EPFAVPTTRESLGPFNGSQVVPVQCHREVRGDQQVATEDGGPFDDGVEFVRQRADRLQPLVGMAAGVCQRYDRIPVENTAGGATELRQLCSLDAVELVHAQSELAGEAGRS